MNIVKITDPTKLPCQPYAMYGGGDIDAAVAAHKKHGHAEPDTVYVYVTPTKKIVSCYIPIGETIEPLQNQR